MFKTGYKNNIGLFVIAIVFAFLSQTVFAAGERDPNFGTGGRVNINFGRNVNLARAAVLQTDGKIVIVGESGDSVFGNTSIAVARLNTDGSLDATFGSNGLVLTNFTANVMGDRATTVAIQSDGKIVVGGSAPVISQNSRRDVFAIARYNPNGSLDTSFGAGGKVFTDLPDDFSEIVAKILIQSDGRIIAIGETELPNHDSTIIMVRYKPNGVEDNEFRQISRAYVKYPVDAGFNDATLQPPNDDILIAGQFYYTYSNCGPPTICQGGVPFLTRFNQDLILDRKFGRRRGVEFGAVWDEFRSISTLPDGRLAVAGRRIRRFNANGLLKVF